MVSVKKNIKDFKYKKCREPLLKLIETRF